MESRSEHSPPEQQTWNGTYFTPQPQGTAAHTEPATQDTAQAAGMSINSGVCARVCAQLQSLLDNDASIRPEAATALYTHLAVCAECAREYEEMTRIIHMLEAMPLAEMPADYSPLIMGRIRTSLTLGLCDRVREKLQPLLDNDPGIRPEMATALHGHLAVCQECSGEFSAMRHMVNLLETMPPAELPIDYSAQIMRRIQSGAYAGTAAKEQAAPGPTFAASSLVSEGVATRSLHRRVQNQTATSTLSAETRLSAWQRLVASVALSGMFIYLLASDWGRQMLGVNLEIARVWLTQVGDHVEQAPVLGALIVSLSAALASMDEALGHTFATLGGMAAQTLALEVSLGLAVCLVINARRKMRVSGI